MTPRRQAVPEQVERSFRDWQQSLVEQKRSKNPAPALIAKQQQLVAAATSSDGLASYLNQRLGTDPESIAAVPSLQGVTADEMLNFPLEWELHVGQQLREVEPQQALSSAWWYTCHIAWLRAGVFPNPPDVAFGARVNPRVLSSDPATMPSTASETLDKATRNLLRRLGGLPHIRHLYRVAEDPPIPRAYWRHRLAADAAASAPADANLTAEECHRILRISSWSRFIERSQQTYSSLLSPRALAAVCAAAQSSRKGVRDEHLQAIAQRCLQAHPDLTDWEALSRAPDLVPAAATESEASTPPANNRHGRRRRRR